MVGLGIVIRDSKGLVMLSSSRNLDACYSSDIAEAGAIFLSDSSSVISLINARNSIFADIASVLANIFDLRDSYPFIRFLFAPRNLNNVAHQLAKMALVKDVNFVLLEEVPSTLCFLV
ncbi:hypothetical protein ACOSP7_004768 [Xanthoceras sorbifolium]